MATPLDTQKLQLLCAAVLRDVTGYNEGTIPKAKDESWASLVNESLPALEEFLSAKAEAVVVGPLKYGTKEEHLETLKQARKTRVDYVWSGDVRRNPYLAESLQFGVDNKIIEIQPDERDQESGWRIIWLQPTSRKES